MNSARKKTQTICAIATPPGRGGIGVVRVSGSQVTALAEAVLGRLPVPRRATFSAFKDGDGNAMDRGLALYFPAPHSFTGEDVLELHAHGGPVVLGLLMERLLQLGARQARPGEFSERAFLNDKLDLAQAEAVADLIASQTAQAARAAARSLEGEFSDQIQALLQDLVNLRVFVEGALDFPDEEIEFLQQGQVAQKLEALDGRIETLLRGAAQGRLLRDGLTVVIAGPPNAGKSSLLNALAGAETAIVTDIPGTTRDMLREQIQIRGMPVHVVDTAGLRAHTTDPVEREGVRRAQVAMAGADRVLYVTDVSEPDDAAPPASSGATTWVHNKIDLAGHDPALRDNHVWLSAKTGQGLDLLRTHLAEVAGFSGDAEGAFSARGRHLDALRRVQTQINAARAHIDNNESSELAAEELRLAQNALGEITGTFTTEDLLGQIFASFCIGK